MPEPDNGPMDLGRYLSVLGPFEILVTVLAVAGLVALVALVVDLAIRSYFGEKP